MHSFRIPLALAFGCIAGAAVTTANAEDNRLDLVAPPAARADPPATPKAYWKPVATAWRTIVIPARRPETAPLPAAISGASPTSPQSRPLTGYAHQLGGLASYYWQVQMTSSGERFDRRGMTAAHLTLPLGTRVRVTNLSNGKSAVVRINDRGPFKPGRVIDVSEAAAEQLAMTGAGLARVAIEVVH